MDKSDRLYIEKLYHDYHRLMFKQARRYFQDQNQLEDIVQLTCLKLIRYLPTIKQLSSNTLAAYIVSIVRSVSIDYYRNQDTARTTSFIDLDESFEENLRDPFDLVDLEQNATTIEKLKWVILQLPEEDQLVLLGKYLYGWSDSELAGSLGVKSVTVRSRLFRAKKKALQLLGDMDEE